MLGSAQIDSSYIIYFNHCNEGDKQIYLKHYDSALVAYQQAFETVDYVHLQYLIAATECAIRLNNIDAGNNLMRKCLINGAISTDFSKKLLKQFNKKFQSQILDSANHYHKIQVARINQKYQIIVDSLYFVDQYIIRGSKWIKGDYYIEETSLPENRHELDSLIFQDLLALIDKYGFPSEKLIGRKSYHKAAIILHHNVRLPKNSQYLELCKFAVFEGKYLPDDYAWMYDQGLMFRKKDPFFYWGVTGIDHLSEDKLKAIDMERAKFGIKPFASTLIIKKKKSIIQKKLW